MKKTVKLTESDLVNIIKKVINEQPKPTNTVNTKPNVTNTSVGDTKSLSWGKKRKGCPGGHECGTGCCANNENCVSGSCLIIVPNQ